MKPSKLLAIVAILKHEGRFVHEWLAYHRLLGCEHFFLYDNDPELPLRRQLRAHAAYVTVVDWVGEHDHLPGRNKQTKAYNHALCRAQDYEWLAFLDVDEFITLRYDRTLAQFLGHFPDAGAVLLNWHYFGHNGYFNDPAGLVVESLTRRRKQIGRMAKSICRVARVVEMASAHYGRLSEGAVARDANGEIFQEVDYPGKTAVAHINHYVCRSFAHWMNRPARGDAAFAPGQFPAEQRWRHDPEYCLRQFVQTVAVDMNELADDYLAAWGPAIRSYMQQINHDET